MYILMKMSCSLLVERIVLPVGFGLSSLSLVGLGWVDRSPLLTFLPCPFVVLSLSGKCLATAFTVSPDHDAYCLFFIAAIHVGFVGNRLLRVDSAQVQVVFSTRTHCGWPRWVGGGRGGTLLGLS